jgi:hypothetical protein
VARAIAPGLDFEGEIKESRRLRWGVPVGSTSYD